MSAILCVVLAQTVSVFVHGVVSFGPICLPIFLMLLFLTLHIWPLRAPSHLVAGSNIVLSHLVESGRSVCWLANGRESVGRVEAARGSNTRTSRQDGACDGQAAWGRWGRDSQR